MQMVAAGHCLTHLLFPKDKYFAFWLDVKSAQSLGQCTAMPGRQRAHSTQSSLSLNITQTTGPGTGGSALAGGTQGFLCSLEAMST